ncbi:MAG: T9SS type A sorting domain-containing protein, partial [Bacteroidetes bacterium]|nr:T9SS type A sorting domain-containing protein [Bacteroidota bacterium]
PYSLFSIDLSDNSVERMSRVTGLSETGISTIFYDESNQKLIIAYSNSNVDIIYRNDIYNIPDLKREVVSGDKMIYRIYSFNGNYYLSTGLGMIIIDGSRYEIKDSWFIGNNGNHVKVNGFTANNGFFYAATEEGLKKAPQTGANLADYNNWQMISGANGLTAGACTDVFDVQGKLVVLKSDSLFTLNNNSWNLLYADGWPVLNAAVSGSNIILCQRQSNGNSKVTILNADGTIAKTLQQPNVISLPRKAIAFNNDYWVADQYGSLSDFTSTGFQQYKLNSPQETASGEMLVSNSVLYATAGEVNDSWNYQYNGNGVYKFAEGEWTNYNRYNFPVLDSLLDFITVAVDPVDASAWAGSYGGGLLHIKNDQSFEIFKQGIVNPTVGDPTSYRVSGLAFDTDHNLWVSNFGAAQPLMVKKTDGGWQHFTVPYSLFGNAVSQIVVDDNNYKWVISPQGNGLLCFDDGSTIDNTADDRWKIYRSGSGYGNLPSSDVLCIAKDKDGFIWVGTSDGIGIIQCTQDVFTAQSCEAYLPIVQFGNFANYLFKGQEVRSIAVDGANRKWVATQNGVWLISADGENVIYQFTEDNSPLLSSDVKKISIDGKTGEVYFATLKGICSFRSTATEGGETNSNVLVFPNPVPPGYGGMIAIKGLADNAIVKITEMNGRLVYQTRALGGQAIWDGKNYTGQKIASGVYLVLISDDSKTVKTAAKIIFIQK